MGYGSTTHEADMLIALQAIDNATDNVSDAVSSGYMRVDLAYNSLGYDGAFYSSSSGYGIADSLYNSSGGTVADMLYDSSAGSVASQLYNAFSGGYAPFWYYGYSLAYMMYELYSCVSSGRLMTSPDNY